MIEDYDEISAKAWLIAHDAGWHERPRFSLEILALVHSEIAEATEAFREHGICHWYTDEKGKPEGVFAELADVVIRIGDAIYPHGAGHVPPPSAIIGELRSMLPMEVFGWLHLRVTRFSGLAANLGDVEAAAIFLGCEDFGQVIGAKMAYNATRPRRHGGKHA